MVFSSPFGSSQDESNKRKRNPDEALASNITDLLLQNEISAIRAQSMFADAVHGTRGCKRLGRCGKNRRGFVNTKIFPGTS